MSSHCWLSLQGVVFTAKNPPINCVSFLNSLKLSNTLHGSSTSLLKNLRVLTTEYNASVTVNDYLPNWSLCVIQTEVSCKAGTEFYCIISLNLMVKRIGLLTSHICPSTACSTRDSNERALTAVQKSWTPIHEEVEQRRGTGCRPSRGTSWVNSNASC
jgi:hypothetical protein